MELKAGPMEGEDRVTSRITLIMGLKEKLRIPSLRVAHLNVLLLVQLIIVSVDTKPCTSIIFTGLF